jgi:hypothetical protein
MQIKRGILFWWSAVNEVERGCGAIIPPTRVPQALKQRRRVPVDKMHLSADSLVKE